MGRKSKTGIVATTFAVLAFWFVFIAFVSPYWLETDGKLKDPKFRNIGKFLKFLRLLVGVVLVCFTLTFWNLILKRVVWTVDFRIRNNEVPITVESHMTRFVTFSETNHLEWRTVCQTCTVSKEHPSEKHCIFRLFFTPVFVWSWNHFSSSPFPIYSTSYIAFSAVGCLRRYDSYFTLPRVEGREFHDVYECFRLFRRFMCFNTSMLQVLKNRVWFINIAFSFSFWLIFENPPLLTILSKLILLVRSFHFCTAV